MKTILNEKNNTGLRVYTFKRNQEIVTRFSYVTFSEQFETHVLFQDFSKTISHGNKRATAKTLKTCHEQAIAEYGEQMIKECEAHQAKIKE